MEFPSEKKNQNLESQILFVQSKRKYYLCGNYYGADWIWQRFEVVSKHAVRTEVGTIISAFNNLSGENNFALAA